MQSQCKQVIDEFYRQYRRMPSYSEIMARTGYQSKSAVAYAIRQLLQSGAIGKDSTGRLIPAAPTATEREVPFVGLVEAGFPSPAEEELADTMSIDDYLVENREATYLMRAKGDSMKDAGIVEGDMLLVERTTTARPGDIVIALLDGERTMKYLRKRGNRHYLEPANPDYRPLVPEHELTIEAVVKGVIRKY